MIYIDNILHNAIELANGSEQFISAGIKAEFRSYRYYDDELHRFCIKHCIKVNGVESLTIVQKDDIPETKASLANEISVAQQVISWLAVVALPVLKDVNVYQIDGKIIVQGN